MYYLYIKTHNITGLKYLGYTSKDPIKYRGSGKHWLRHINKHGYDVTTIVLYETPYKEEIREQGLYYSDLWNIVYSNNYANLVPESGDGVIPTEETRRKIGEANKGNTHTEEAKKKIGEASIGNTHTLGRNHTEEAKKKMSYAMKGRKFSEETKRKLRISGRGYTHMLGKTHSEETKERMRISSTGKTHSEETRRKLSNANKGNTNMLGKTHTEESKKKMSDSINNIPKINCPHCNKIGGSSIMKRWHFNNCKFKTTI